MKFTLPNDAECDSVSKPNQLSRRKLQYEFETKPFIYFFKSCQWVTNTPQHQLAILHKKDTIHRQKKYRKTSMLVNTQLEHPKMAG